MTEAEMRISHSLELINEAEKSVLAGMHFLSAAKAKQAIAKLNDAIYALEGLQLIQQSCADQKQADALAEAEFNKTGIYAEEFADLPSYLQRQAD